MTIAIEVKTCLHDSRGVCWLCSSQDPRWAEWRVRAGLPAEPPNRGDPVQIEKTMTEEEERGWLTAMTRPSVTVAPKRVRMPRKVTPPVVMEPVEPGKWADVYDYWDAHPKLTLAEAERAVRRLQRAAV